MPFSISAARQDSGPVCVAARSIRLAMRSPILRRITQPAIAAINACLPGGTFSILALPSLSTAGLPSLSSSCISRTGDGCVHSGCVNSFCKNSNSRPPKPLIAAPRIIGSSTRSLRMLSTISSAVVFWTSPSESISCTRTPSSVFFAVKSFNASSKSCGAVKGLAVSPVGVGGAFNSTSLTRTALARIFGRGSVSAALIVATSTPPTPSSAHSACRRPSEVSGSGVEAILRSAGITDSSLLSTISRCAVSRHQPLGWDRCLTSSSGVSVLMCGLGPGFTPSATTR